MLNCCCDQASKETVQLVPVKPFDKEAAEALEAMGPPLQSPREEPPDLLAQTPREPADDGRQEMAVSSTLEDVAPFPMKQEASEEPERPAGSAGASSSNERFGFAGETEAVKGAHIVLTFGTKLGHSKTVTVAHRPLHMTFHSAYPVVVSASEGRSKALGIESGDTLQAINGSPVNTNFDVFFADFAKRMEQLPFNYEVEFEFMTDSGEKKTVSLKQRPIEMTFAASLPIIIASTQGHSKDQGVEAGWQLKRFDGHNVDDCVTFEDFCDDFKVVLASLPKIGTPPATPR